MSRVRWLIDKSALWRTGVPAVGDVVRPAVLAGAVGVSIATELEVGYSARSTEDYWLMRSTMVDHLLPVPLPFRAEQRAREVQALLVERGEHRRPASPTCSSRRPPRSSGSPCCTTTATSTPSRR